MGLQGLRQGSVKALTQPTTGLSAVAMNGAAGTRTFTVDTEGYTTMRVYVDFTHANNGTLTLTVTDSPDSGTTYHTPYAGSTLVAANTYATGSLSGDTDYSFEVDVTGMHDISCVLAHGGSAGAGDLVTLKYVLVAE